MTSNSDSATSADQPAPTIGPPDVIGTPLSPTATKVMVLGAGELGKEVVIAFQRLGVEVVAVDRYANAPGQQVAHHAEVIDMTDPEALLAVIDKHRPAYVVPEIEAIATEALVDVAERGVAEVIPTASAVVATMNREGIRRLADEELGLPTAPYLFADTLEELAEAVGQIGFPCVVKPVMSSSGKGQSVLRGPDDVASAWETANTGGRVQGNRVIVEGFIEFDYEITLLTVRAIDPRTGTLTSHFCAPIGHRQINGDYVESWQPHEMSPDAHASATSIAARIATALGDGKLAGRGVFGVELFVKGDDVYFSEVSPRPHDTGLVTMATQRLSEFEMHARASLGLPVDVTLASPGRHRIRERRRGTCGARDRHPPVRQAGELPPPAHGCGHRDRRRRSRRPRTRRARGVAGDAGTRSGRGPQGDGPAAAPGPARTSAPSRPTAGTCRTSEGACRSSARTRGASARACRSSARPSRPAARPCAGPRSATGAPAHRRSRRSAADRTSRGTPSGRSAAPGIAGPVPGDDVPGQDRGLRRRRGPRVTRRRRVTGITTGAALG